jgi:predicted small metal-binding protein
MRCRLSLYRPLSAWYIYPSRGSGSNGRVSLAKKVLVCSEAGLVCGAKVTGDSEDEVLRKAVEHAREDHGVDLTQAKTLARYAQSLIRDDDGGRG